MQIVDKIGEKYQLINGDVVAYNELCQDEKIRLYQKEHNCDLETATCEILTQEEEQEQEEKRKEYASDPDMAEDSEGNFHKLEGVEEDAQIRELMKTNGCSYEEGYNQIYSQKTQEGESKYSSQSDGDKIVLRDNETGRVIKFSKDEIGDYRERHDCSFAKAESELYSKAISELKARCY